MMGIKTSDVLNLCSRVGGSGRMEVLRVESDTDEYREADILQNPLHFNFELNVMLKNTIHCARTSLPISKSIRRGRGKATELDVCLSDSKSP